MYVYIYGYRYDYIHIALARENGALAPAFARGQPLPKQVLAKTLLLVIYVFNVYILMYR